jgi:hypothetical protein
MEGRVDINSVRTAGALLASQSFVPLSPATRDDSGRVCLCAAAMLASAGLRTKVSLRKAQEFDMELAETKSKDLVYHTFERLGWPAELCREMMDRNDTSATERRREVVASLLQNLS